MSPAGTSGSPARRRHAGDKAFEQLFPSVGTQNEHGGSRRSDHANRQKYNDGHLGLDGNCKYENVLDSHVDDCLYHFDRGNDAGDDERVSAKQDFYAGLFDPSQQAPNNEGFGVVGTSQQGQRSQPWRDGLWCLDPAAQPLATGMMGSSNNASRMNPTANLKVPQVHLKIPPHRSVRQESYRWPERNDQTPSVVPFDNSQGSTCSAQSAVSEQSFFLQSSQPTSDGGPRPRSATTPDFFGGRPVRSIEDSDPMRSWQPNRIEGRSNTMPDTGHHIWSPSGEVHAAPSFLDDAEVDSQFTQSWTDEPYSAQSSNALHSMSAFRDVSPLCYPSPNTTGSAARSYPSSDFSRHPSPFCLTDEAKGGQVLFTSDGGLSQQWWTPQIDQIQFAVPPIPPEEYRSDHERQRVAPRSVPAGGPYLRQTQQDQQNCGTGSKQLYQTPKLQQITVTPPSSDLYDQNIDSLFVDNATSTASNGCLDPSYLSTSCPPPLQSFSSNCNFPRGTSSSPVEDVRLLRLAPGPTTRPLSASVSPTGRSHLDVSFCRSRPQSRSRPQTETPRLVMTSRRRSIAKYGPLKTFAPNLVSRSSSSSAATATSSANLDRSTLHRTGSKTSTPRSRGRRAKSTPLHPSFKTSHVSRSSSQKQLTSKQGQKRGRCQDTKNVSPGKGPTMEGISGSTDGLDDSEMGTNVDFVNYTPKDADKLLSDVAPSGSSKTRARREAEAREKQKKLNEVALQAVRQAGGDTKMLEGIILT